MPCSASVRSVIATAQATVGVFIGAALSLITVGRQIAFAGEQAFDVLAADVTLTMEEAAAIGQIASCFGDIACSLVNGFDLIGQFPAGSRLGRLALQLDRRRRSDRPFTAQMVTPFAYALCSFQVPAVSVTPNAQAAMLGLAGDPLQG